MSDEYLAEWRPYKVTAEQLPKLQRKEKEAIDAFYLENQNELNKLAHAYWRGHMSVRTCCTYEDVQQDLYANLFLRGTKFDDKALFISTIRRSLAYCAIGGEWNPTISWDVKYGNGLQNSPVLKTSVILDREITGGEGDTFSDMLQDGEDPHIALVRKNFILWRESFELQLDRFLKSILPRSHYCSWQEGHEMRGKCRKAIAKRADAILQFMRKHGVPEHVLQRRVETLEEREARIEAQQVLEAWQEEHVKELPPDVQALVKRRIRTRQERERMQRKRAEKARASV